MLKKFALAMASAALVVAPAVSAQEPQTQTVGVSYSDLDLTTDQGRQELERRIDDAAKRACSADQQVTGTRMPTRASRECYRDAKRQLEQHFAQLIEDQRLGG